MICNFTFVPVGNNSYCNFVFFYCNFGNNSVQFLEKYRFGRRVVAPIGPPSRSRHPGGRYFIRTLSVRFAPPTTFTEFAPMTPSGRGTVFGGERTTNDKQTRRTKK